MKYRLIYTLLGILLYLPVSAQHRDSVQVRRNNYLAASFHNAYLLAHYPELENIAGFYNALDLRYFYTTNGDKYWHWAYNYPKIGLGLNFGQYKQSQIGKMAAGYIFGTFPVTNLGRIKLEWDLCTGMGWVEGIYNETDNPNNIGVSTHWNGFLDLNLNATIPISNRVEGYVAFGISHFSNGSGRKPNMGLNLVGLRTGVVYRLEETKAPISVSQYPEINKKWGFDIRYGTGKLGITGSNTRFKAGNAQFIFAKRVSKRHRLGFAFDLIQDNSLVSKQYLLDGEHSSRLGYLLRKKEGEKAPLYQGGVLLSSEFIMRRLSLMVQAGYILVYSYDQLPVYERFGIRYRLLDGLFADMSMRAHANKAFDITWGLGYSLNRGRD